MRDTRLYNEPARPRTAGFDRLRQRSHGVPMETDSDLSASGIFEPLS